MSSVIGTVPPYKILLCNFSEHLNVHYSGTIRMVQLHCFNRKKQTNSSCGAVMLDAQILISSAL